MDRARLGVLVAPSKKVRFALPDLKQGECKWPVHETNTVVGGFLFCAEATGDALRSYCAVHTRIASGRIVA